jgi:hypothetical protein
MSGADQTYSWYKTPVHKFDMCSAFNPAKVHLREVPVFPDLEDTNSVPQHSVYTDTK